MVVDKSEIDYDAMEKKIGVGPMRFAPKNEKSIIEQINNLSVEEKQCFDNLKSRWEKEFPDNDAKFTDEMYLRFARCSPGKTKFNEKAAWKVMLKNKDHRYIDLKITDLENQLLSKTLFPVPGLQTSEGHDVFYMRPSRYFPKKTSTQEIINNLAYCMETMVEKEKACTEGIGFVAYMSDWAMTNFSINYCYQFMMMLQGKVPVRVRMFLIVNPPGWFDKIWSIMKPMLAKDFRKKVHMIPESELHTFLMDGYEQYLPDDITTIGKASTEDMVKDFVTYRKYVESL